MKLQISHLCHMDFHRRRAFLRGSWILLAVLLGVAAQAQAASATTTTLSIAPGTSLTTGTVVTLQASVGAGGTPVTQGTVVFYDGAAVLASAQVVGRGVAYTHGTANCKLYLGPGTHTMKAVYGGTSLFTASASAPTVITVVLASPAPTATTISATGVSGNYTLTGTVTALSAIAPTGTVSFLDQSNGNFLLGSAPLSLPSQANAWGSAATFATGGSTYGVILADLNADGILDLVTTNYGGTTMSVLLGNGDGTFQPHVDYAAGTLSFGLAAGDLNGDGIPDLAVASGTSNAVRVFLGNGDGTFQAAQVYDTVGVAEYAVVADFNRDGILDLATCSASVASISVLLGNGDGTFAAAQTFGSSVFPDGLAVGDFNGDGNPDLAVANKTINTVSIFLGKGDGTFLAPADWPTGSSPTNIAVADLNADGKADLVVTNSVGTAISVFLGNGDGTFQSKVDYSGFSGPWGVVTADVNGDGIPDVVASSPGTQSVEVLQGNGDGTLQSPVTTATGVTNYLLALGDLNGDGVVDLGVPNVSTSLVEVLIGSISATSTLAGVSVPGGGTHNVVASYAGDTSSGPSTSAPIGLAGTPFVTTISLSGAPSSGPPGQTFIFTATISPSSSSGFTASGTITFLDSGMALGAPVTLVNGSATLSTSALSSGMHSITATYSGDTNFLGSASSPPLAITVLTPQTITFPQPNPVAYGVAPFTLNATASSGLPVSFTVVSGPATVMGATLTILGAGNVVIQADQAGDTTHTSAQPVQRTLVVNKASSAIALSASPSSVNVNANVTLTANVSGSSSGGSLPAPTGVVTFFNGSTQLAPVPVNGSGTAAYSTTSLPAGVNSITAIYAGDSNFAASTSAATPVSVAAPQTITFPPLNPVTYGVAPLTLSATASSGLPVTLSLVSGQATLVGNTLTLPAAGTVVIQADQAGNSSYPPAAAVRRTLLVNRAPSSVVLTASANHAPPGTSITFTATVSSGGLRAPTGSVVFLDRTLPLATAALNSLGVATYSTSSLSIGDHILVAYYGGDSNFAVTTTTLDQAVVGPTYYVTANPASLTVKLGQTATSTVTIKPVGGFRGQVSLVCAGAPEIASCSLSPTTVVLPGDDLPKTVQFNLTTSVVKATQSASFGYGAGLALLSPLGFAVWMSRASGWRRRRVVGFWVPWLVPQRRRLWILALGLLLLGLGGCGWHTAPFGNWTIVMTSTTGGANPPQNAMIHLTITP